MKIGDIVKVVKGRKVPIGTIGKITDMWDEAYGGRYIDDEGTNRAIQGWNNETTYVRLNNDLKLRTNIENCVPATPEEIETFNQEYNEVKHSEYLGNIDNIVKFEGKAKFEKSFVGNSGADINKYLITTVDENLVSVWTPLKFEENKNYHFSGIIKDLTHDKHGEKVTEVNKLQCQELKDEEKASNGEKYKFCGNPGDTVEFTARPQFVEPTPNSGFDLNVYAFEALDALFLVYLRPDRFLDTTKDVTVKGTVNKHFEKKGLKQTTLTKPSFKY